MKKVFIMICMLTFTGMHLYSQSWLEKIGNRVKEKVVQKVEQRIDDKTEEMTDKALDKSEDSIKKAGKKGSKSASSEGQVGSRQSSDASYLKYDFVPGNEIIFEDDLRGEQKGEFPSKWDLIEGNAEIAQINGENVLAIVGFTYITPLFKDKNYKLPDAFTLEYDFLIDKHDGEHSLEFMNDNNEAVASSLFWKDNERFLFSWNLTENERSSEDSYSNTPGWHHYALSFNKRAIKVYIDNKRVANIPNAAARLSKVRFFARGSENNSVFHIKNIRLAKGAVPLYDRLMTDGKIVTYGITFDVGKATIKKESMGTINEIFGILQSYPSIKFSVEGHTDNTGTAASNQTLSEARAKAVCEKLQQLGIEASRLSAKGYGMSKPLDTNATPEGRAKNRRVEFVKK